MKQGITALAIAIALVTGCVHYRTHTLPPEDRQERTVSVKKPPRLILIRGVGVYYAPEADDDIFFYGGTWYYFSGDTWYLSQSHKGPWEEIQQNALPTVMFRVPPENFKRVPPGWRDVYQRG